MKKPEEVKIMLNVERKKSEFVRWDGKPLYDYFINIPTWLSQSYFEHGSRFVILQVSKKKSMYQKMQEQNESEWRPWVKKRWSKKLTDMRKINNGYMKIMTSLSPRAFFDTHEGYIEYHKELKKLNEKYMKPCSTIAPNSNSSPDKSWSFNMGDKVSATPTPKEATLPSHHPNIKFNKQK